MTKMKETALFTAPLTRRGFVKASGAAGGLAVAAGGLSLPFSHAASAAEITPAPAAASDEKVVWSACTVNCGSRCPLRMHVVDGEIR